MASRFWIAISQKLVLVAVPMQQVVRDMLVTEPGSDLLLISAYGNGRVTEPCNFLQNSSVPALVPTSTGSVTDWFKVRGNKFVFTFGRL